MDVERNNAAETQGDIVPPGHEDEPPRYVTKKKRRRISRSSFIKLVSQCNDLKSPAAERLRLQSTFFDLYASKDGSRFPGCEFFVANATSHAVMRSALDTLCLLTLSASNQRRHLYEHARGTYSETLRLFRRELNIVPVQNPFVLLQTVHVIQLCEMFGSNGWAWQAHMNGLDVIIANASLEGRKDCGEKGRDLIERDNRISFSLWDGLLARKDLETAEELFTVPGHSPDAEMSSRLVIDRQVPGVLRYSKHVASQGKRASAGAVSDAVGRIVGMEGRLHAAMTMWYAGMGEMSYRISSVRNFEGSLPAQLIDITAFPHAFEFQNMASALKHVHYWSCLLNLRQVHVEIRQAVKPSAYSLGLYESVETLHQKTEECADSLCMAIAYMTAPKSGYFGYITAIPPLQMAARWYRLEANLAKLMWCHGIARRLRQKGLAIPDELFTSRRHTTTT